MGDGKLEVRRASIWIVSLMKETETEQCGMASKRGPVQSGCQTVRRLPMGTSIRGKYDAGVGSWARKRMSMREARYCGLRCVFPNSYVELLILVPQYVTIIEDKIFKQEIKLK